MPALPRLRAALTAPVDAASLIAFRVAFGLLMCASVIRFAARGWIDELYVAPDFHFHYWGFGWIEPLPAAGLYAVFAALGIHSPLVVAGKVYRPAIPRFIVTFTYL